MPLQIGILSDSRSLTYLGEQIRQRVAGAEREFDVIIEIRTFSRADAPELFVNRTELLTGYLEPRKPMSGQSHEDWDKRAVRFSAAIAEILDHDPSLIKRAVRHLDFLLQENQGPASHDLREWRDILAHYSRQRIKDFLLAETQRAQRLRRSSPFFAVLSPDERDIVLSAAEKH